MADAQGSASLALLRGREREKQAFVWAFHLLKLDGDLRNLPLEFRAAAVGADSSGPCWLKKALRVGALAVMRPLQRECGKRI